MQNTSEIFNAEEILPNDCEQVVIIRKDGYWTKGSWSKRAGWRDEYIAQPVAFWMRVFVPSNEK